MIYDDNLKHIKENRANVLSGKLNCIPCPFDRFRESFPGIRKGFYYLISGATKSAKTQFTTYFFIIDPILKYINNPNAIKPTILYFPLEETKEDIMLRIYSHIIAYLSNNKILISPENIESINENKPIPIEVLNMIESDEFKKIISVFEDRIIFFDNKSDRNPTGISKDIKKYVFDNGEIIRESYIEKLIDEWGNESHNEKQRIVEYIPNDPNEYIIPIIDHVGLLTTEKQKTLKETIEQLSADLVYQRNTFSISPVVIQQQNSETTNLEAINSSKIRPTKDGLKDSKRTGEDCSVFFGITNPYAFGLKDPTYLGYDIKKLKDNFRILEIVLARKGRSNEMCPLFFNGATNQFYELPRIDDSKINDFYKRIEEIRQKSK